MSFSCRGVNLDNVHVALDRTEAEDNDADNAVSCSYVEELATGRKMKILEENFSPGVNILGAKSPGRAPEREILPLEIKLDLKAGSVFFGGVSEKLVIIHWAFFPHTAGMYHGGP